MIAVIHELLGEIEECFTSRVDVQSTVNNPAGGGAVLNCVPHIAVTGDNGVALFLQLCSCFEELIPVAGACADLLSDEFRIIIAPDILSDGTTVDKCTACCLIAKAYQLAVGGTGADIDGVLSNVSSLRCGCNINTQILVCCCILCCIALSILQHECCFCTVDVRSVSAAGGESLVKCRLVQAVSGSNDGGLNVVLFSNIGMCFHVLCDHARNFIREGHDVDGGFAISGCAHCTKAEYHAKSKSKCENFLHFGISSLKNNL